MSSDGESNALPCKQRVCRADEARQQPPHTRAPPSVASRPVHRALGEPRTKQAQMRYTTPITTAMICASRGECCCWLRAGCTALAAELSHPTDQRHRHLDGARQRQHAPEEEPGPPPEERVQEEAAKRAVGVG